MFEIFESYYTEELEHINFNKDDNISIYSELINKQIDKSIFKDNKLNIYNYISQSVVSTILNNGNNIQRYYYNFEMALFFSDIYTIFRIFKANFNTKESDKCKTTPYFKNIIYVGGKLHVEILGKFIHWLKYHEIIIKIDTSIKPQYAQVENVRCIEFDEPIEIF